MERPHSRAASGLTPALRTLLISAQSVNKVSARVPGIVSSLADRCRKVSSSARDTRGAFERSVRSVLRRGSFHSSLFTLHSPLSTCAAALAAALALARGIDYGVGLEFDSLNYISTARSLLAGEGFYESLGRAHTGWPPLYALTLAVAAGLCGRDPLAVAGPLNAAIFGLTVFVLGLYLRRRLQSRFAAAWACAALALSVPLADEAAWALSEPLFLLTSTLALIATDDYLRAGGARSLLGAAAYGALAWQARYSGVAAPLFIGALLLCRRGAPRRRKLREAAVVWLTAGLPMALWLLRNSLTDNGIIGSTLLHDVSLPQVLREIGGILWTWTHFELPAAAAVAIAAAALIAAAARGAAPLSTLHSPLSTGGGAAAAMLFSGYALTYLVLLAALMMTGNAAGSVFPRYVLPVYVPLLTAAAFALDRLSRAGRGSRGSAGRLPAAAVAAALCLWTAGQAAPHARRIAQANAGETGGFNGPRWAASETLRHIRENPIDGTVYGNWILLTSFHNTGTAAYRNLHTVADGKLLHGAPPPASAAAGQERLRARLAAAPDGAWLVWFKSADNDNLLGYGEAWLRVAPGLETAAEFADGGIYRIRKRAAPRENRYRAALGAAAPPVESGEWRVESGTPSAAGGGPGFDVSVRGGELVYVKQPCTAQDARRRFLLHVYPADAAVLPAAQRPHGFANLDFYFPEYGAALEGGACVALHPLPGYAIERIETGQYVRGEGAAWRAALRAAVDSE